MFSVLYIMSPSNLHMTKDMCIRVIHLQLSDLFYNVYVISNIKCTNLLDKEVG